MDLLDIGKREPQKRRPHYNHLNPFEYYLDDENGEYEEFRKIYRFRKTTVKELAKKFEPELTPKMATNNAYCCEEKLTIALKFYANRCFQKNLGQAEGPLQSTVFWIVEEVSKVLAEHCNALTKFSVDDVTLDTVSTGFFGFTKSEYETNLKLCFQFISSNMKSTNTYIKYMCQGIRLVRYLIYTLLLNCPVPS